MTSREIVLATLACAGPERVARSFHDSDIAGAACDAATHVTDWAETGGGRWERTDEWGNTWARLDPTSKGEVVRGVLDNLDDADALALPDFSQAASYDPVRRLRAEQPDKFLLGHLPGFAFNIARKLRRIDQYLVDLLEAPDRLHALHDRIDAVLEVMIRRYAEAGADGVMFPEDWGTQSQLFIAPELWHAEYAPRFRRLCALAHDSGASVWMHSCGRIGAIVPALIGAGIDVLQFDQPELHGIDALAAYQERARVTFWCPVDIQQTLPTRDEALIRARAREMIRKLWRRRGGFIAGFYDDNPSLGLDPVWQEHACDEFIRCGAAQ